jgi:hypothetical protein
MSRRTSISLRGEDGEAAGDEGADGRRALVGVELGVGQARMVVDERMDVLVADGLAPLRAGAVAVARDRVPGPREA